MHEHKQRKSNLGASLAVTGLILILGAVLVAGGFAPWNRSETPSTARQERPFAVYLEPVDIPADQHIQIPAKELESRGVTTVSTVEELTALVETTEPPSLWINGAALPEVPEAWLRGQREQGVVIVGIKLTKRELGSALGVTPGGSPDWQPQGVPTYAMYWEALDIPYTNPHGEPAVRGGYSWLNDDYDPTCPDVLFNVVEQAVKEIKSL